MHQDSVMSWKRSTNLLVEVFPVVLSHESEQREERPAEGVKTGVAVVGITATFDTYVALWTESVSVHKSVGKEYNIWV